MASLTFTDNFSESTILKEMFFFINIYEIKQ